MSVSVGEKLGRTKLLLSLGYSSTTRFCPDTPYEGTIGFWSRMSCLNQISSGHRLLRQCRTRKYAPDACIIVFLRNKEYRCGCKENMMFDPLAEQMKHNDAIAASAWRRTTNWIGA